MNKIQAGRALTLAYYLETEVPRKKFEITCVREDFDDDRDPVEQALDPECGATCCAWGFTPVLFPKHFRYTGLWHVEYLNSHDDTFDLVGASEDFFGFDAQDCDHTFTNCNLTTPKKLAKEIRKVVAQHGWEEAE